MAANVIFCAVGTATDSGTPCIDYSKADPTYETVASAGASSNTLGTGQTHVKICAIAAGYWRVGTAGQATTTDNYLPAGGIEFAVIKQGTKIAWVDA